MNNKKKNYLTLSLILFFFLKFATTMTNHVSYDSKYSDNYEEQYEVNLGKASGNFLMISGASTTLFIVCAVSTSGTGVIPALYLSCGTAVATGVMMKAIAEYARAFNAKKACESREEKERKKQKKQ